MSDLTAQKDISPVLTDIPRYEGPVGIAPRSYELEPLAPWKIPRINLGLFLLTLLTTTMAGADMSGAIVSLAHPLETLPNLAAGLSFSIPLLLILGSHEMGHYVTSRYHRVDTTLPYFIPAPFPSYFFVGTFGAFIMMKSRPRTRRALFDIGAAGPWAGAVVSVIALIVGLKFSPVTPLDTSQGGLQLGNSILFWGLSWLVLGVNPNSVNVNLSPIAFAGWIGLLVTAINLMPVGQLDGGHVIYALFGDRWHRRISRTTWLGFALLAVVPYLLGTEFWAGWAFWFVIVLLLGLGHPATIDADTPLAGRRRKAAFATIVLFALTFSPVPAWIAPPTAPQPEGQMYSVMHKVPGDHAPLGHAISINI